MEVVVEPSVVVLVSSSEQQQDFHSDYEQYQSLRMMTLEPLWNVSCSKATIAMLLSLKRSWPHLEAVFEAGADLM